MPKTFGTSGKTVTYELLGVGELIKKLNEVGKMVSSEIEIALVRVAARLEEEIKESIAGNRNEIKSVDTGNFLNSITTKKYKNDEITIATDTEYSKYLEYGTSKIEPRYHFTNSLERNKEKVIDEINKALKKSIK